MRCIVTGGSGFIGQHIVKALASEGHDVVVFDIAKPEFLLPSNVEFVEGDVRYYGSVEHVCQGADEVYNVASLLGTSELMFDSARANDTNINGMINVLEVAKRLRIARVFYPTKPNDWLNTYSISKFCAEQYCHMYALNFGMHVTTLKWFNAYGAHQKIFPVRKALPTFIAQALRDKPLEVWGDGEQTVDLIHVEDIARIAIDASRNDNLPAGKICDVGSGEAITVNVLARMVIEFSGSESTIVHKPMRMGEPLKSDIRADVTELKKYVDLPMRNIRAGICETVQAYADLPPGVINKALAYFEAKQRRNGNGRYA